MSDYQIRKLVKGLTVGEYDDLRYPRTIGSALTATSNNPEAQKFSIFMIKRKDSTGALEQKGYIALPIPKISDGVNVTYSDAEFGVAGAVAVGSLGTGISESNTLTDALKVGVRSFNSQTFTRVAADLATTAFPGLKASLVNGLKTIQNPYLTNVFKSTGFREFAFNYVLKPKSKKDSEVIKNIIKAFKKEMMPIDNLISREGESAYGDETHNYSTGIQSLPSLFDIRFYPTTQNYSVADSHKKLVNIQDAVLTDMKVEYSPETPTPVFFEGTNAPFGVNMTLTFKETVIYTRERAKDDYGDLIEDDTSTFA